MISFYFLLEKLTKLLLIFSVWKREREAGLIKIQQNPQDFFSVKRKRTESIHISLTKGSGV